MIGKKHSKQSRSEKYLFYSCALQGVLNTMRRTSSIQISARYEINRLITKNIAHMSPGSCFNLL